MPDAEKRLSNQRHPPRRTLVNADVDTDPKKTMAKLTKDSAKVPPVLVLRRSVTQTFTAASKLKTQIPCFLRGNLTAEKHRRKPRGASSRPPFLLAGGGKCMLSDFFLPEDQFNHSKTKEKSEKKICEVWLAAHRAVKVTTN